MKKIAVLVLIAILSLGVLTACGGGGETKKLEVLMGENNEFKYNPNTLPVKKGENVEVTLVNKDTAQAHTFIIKDLNVKSGQVQPGKSETVKFKATKTGEFETVCDVAGHKEGGMVGKITVTE